MGARSGSNQHGHGKRGPRRLARIVMAVVSLSVLSVGSEAQPAAAVTCTPGNECFAGPIWTMSSPAGTLGAKVTLRSNCMVLSDLTLHRMFNYLLVQESSASTWNYIQIGIRIGMYPGGTHLANPWRYFAYRNATTSQSSLSQYSYTPTTALVATIHKSSEASNDWEMWFGNSTSHVSAPNIFYGGSQKMFAGTAVSDNDARTFGSVSRMYFYNLSDQITAQWQGATSSSVLTIDDPPMKANWVDNDWWAQTGIGSTC